MDPEVRQIVDQAAQVFEHDLGCAVERADRGWPDPYETLRGLVINESDLSGLRKLAGSLGDRMSPRLAEALRAEWTPSS